MSELRDQHKAFAEWFLQQNPIAPNVEDMAWAAWKAALAQPEAHPPRDEWRPASELDTLRELIGLAYGHLWMVNNEPGTPNRYSPERAAYEARKLLRDTMTQEQRGAFINRVIAQRRPPPTEGK